jgi:hypothetical protein
VTTIGETILAEAYRGRAQRDQVLEATRARAGWTLAAASIAAAVLTAGHQPGWLGIPAAAAFAVLVAFVVNVYRHRRWRDVADVGELIRNYIDADHVEDVANLQRDLASIHYSLYLEHDKPLRAVQRSTLGALVALGAFVVILLIDRMV